MSDIHHKIIEEIVSEYELKPETLAINIMGSISRGEERPNSDVDIEIVTNERERNFKYEVKNMYEIKVDFIVSSMGQMIYQVENYPFFLLQKGKKCLYDPTGFMREIIKRDQEYANSHPEVSQFWEEKDKIMKERKLAGNPKEKLRDIFDEAEILFSKTGNVTRDWFVNSPK